MAINKPQLKPRKISWARIYSSSYWFHSALAGLCPCKTCIPYIRVGQKTLASPIRLGGHFFEVLWSQ